MDQYKYTKDLGVILKAAGTELSNTYNQLAELVIELEDWQTLIHYREVSLTPEGGWEGKNAEQRDTQRDNEFAFDLILVAFKNKEREVKNNIELLKAYQEDMIAKRRVLEKLIDIELAFANQGEK